VKRNLAAIDDACSRFAPDSELSMLNASGGTTMTISQLLTQAIAVALRAAELTDGLLDPTIGQAIAAAGYEKDWQLLSLGPSLASRLGPSLAAPRAASDRAAPRVRATRRAASWRDVRLHRAKGEVRLPEGVELYLGATAKAWAADLCAAAAAASTGVGVLVCLGGDIATAGQAPPSGWFVHVTEDHRSAPTAPGQTIVLRCGGLATSSTTVRRWVKDGRLMHHIIDPGTGAPAKSMWRTVSVCAADCVDANIASTASILLSDRAPEWLACRGLPARLLATDDSVLTVGAWPQQGSEANARSPQKAVATRFEAAMRSRRRSRAA
jgi:thiamine biosynthesis lipoprotein